MKRLLVTALVALGATNAGNAEHQDTQTPEATFRQFMLSVLKNDAEGVRLATLQTEGADVLWQGQLPPKEMHDELEKSSRAIKLIRIPEGGMISLPDGTSFRLAKDSTSESIFIAWAEVSGERMPRPFWMVKTDHGWRVDAAPLVAASSAFIKAKPSMPLSVPPFYDFRAPKIRTARFSDQLYRADSETILTIAVEMKNAWPVLPVESMFMLAMRLYDYGHKDEAVYWFHSARHRQSLYRCLLSRHAMGTIGSVACEGLHAQQALQQLAGMHINGYAFGDLEKLQATIKTVQSEAEELPDLKMAYPTVAFVGKEKWQQINDKLAERMDELLAMLKRNSDKIKEIREQKGLDQSY